MDGSEIRSFLDRTNSKATNQSLTEDTILVSDVGKISGQCDRRMLGVAGSIPCRAAPRSGRPVRRLSIPATTKGPSLAWTGGAHVQGGIQTKLEQSGPSGLLPRPSTPYPLTRVLVAEMDLARARELLNTRLEGA
jgi:hypothetical protein